MKTFTLNPTPQTEAFLAEKRKDPVTGETFKEGDEIVFCASCKSAFLKGSWEYMGGEHCKQGETLEVFPDMALSRTGLTLKEKGGDTVVKFASTMVNGIVSVREITGIRLFVTITCLLTTIGVFVFCLFVYQNGPFRSLPGIFLFFLFSLLLVSFMMFTALQKRTPLKNELRRSGALFDDKFIPYQDISECRVSSQEFYSTYMIKEEDDEYRSENYISNARITLHFFLHEKEEVYTIRIPEMHHKKKREKCLVELLKVADKIRLVFSPITISETEHKLIEEKARQTGNTYYTESLYHGYF